MTESRGEDPGSAIPADARAQFSELLVGLDGAAAWKATVSAFGEYVPEGFGEDPGADVARRIELDLEAGRPASFIRLGDGEGNFLALALDEYPALAELCARRTSRRMFGVADALLRAAPDVLPAFRNALRNADLIGFPGPFGPEMILTRAPDTGLKSIHGLMSVFAYLTEFADDLELEWAAGASSNFHHLLLPHYETLISGRGIGIVTCRAELVEALRSRMGASAVDLRLVGPKAFPSGRPIPAVEDPAHDNGHWPGRFGELCEELQSIEPGSLWLVAAGILGKVYCDVIRTAGGIAVDIGHTADIWAGIESRVAYDQSEVLAAWRIVD